jgi:excisionase family DNA binding protein
LILNISVMFNVVMKEITTSLVPPAADRPTMQVDAVAEALGLSRATVYTAVQTGEIPSLRIGRRIVVPTAAVRRMLQLDKERPDEP